MVERGTCPKSLVRGANGCRELSRFPAMCLCVLISSGLDGFESKSMRCVAIDSPPRGTPCFPFYRPRESIGYSGGRGENERKKSFRIVGSFFSYMRVSSNL